MDAAATLGVCLALAANVGRGPDLALPAANGPAVRFVQATQFTLAWTHSIEKTRWEEDYSVGVDARDVPHLALERARIRGSGAGMDPPQGAGFHDGWYEYVPVDQPAGPLRLTRSGYTADFDWCAHGQQCGSMADLLPSDGDVTLLWACTLPAEAPADRR